MAETAVAQDSLAHRQPIRLDGISILLVEDEIDTRNALAKLLQNSGARVSPAGSVPEAVAAYRRARPDIILTDLGMPEEDGYALVQQIRSLEQSNGAAPVPAVAVTAFARDEDRRAALEAGFQRFLSKPVEPMQLLITIRAMIAANAEAGAPADGDGNGEK